MSEWISVKDRLPSSKAPVIAYFVNEYRRPCVIRAGYAGLHVLELDEDCEGGCACGSCEGEWCEPGWYEMNVHEEVHWRVEDITHWMPLPDPPNDAAKRETSKGTEE